MKRLIFLCILLLFFFSFSQRSRKHHLPLPREPCEPRGPSATLIQSTLSSLLKKLRDVRGALEIKYNTSSAHLRRFIVIGPGLPLHLGSKLTAAFLGAAPFVVGITGGSSTAGDFSWPALLHDWLSRRMNLSHVDVRNAAQGTTSQLVTAPCIRALVGDDVDLLLWEFAMNDEYEYIRNDQPPRFPMRGRVVEAYIRQAIALNPGAIGFVHIWDLDIHQYQTGDELPNKAFKPTTEMMASYSSVYDRYFAFDTLGLMASLQLYKNKTEFLRDLHHPNDFGYSVIIDILTYTILQAWIEYLELKEQPIMSSWTALWHMPPLTKKRDNLVLPSQYAYAHCFMAMPPQFSEKYSLFPVLPSCSGDLRKCLQRADVGKADPNRADRQDRFVAPECKSVNGTVTPSGIQFSVFVQHVTHVLLDCGYSHPCLGKVRVFFDEKPIVPNVDVEGDILSAFYAWIHKLSGVKSAKIHSIHICGLHESALFSRLVVIEARGMD